MNNSNGKLVQLVLSGSLHKFPVSCGQISTNKKLFLSELDARGAFTWTSYQAFWSCIGRLRGSSISCQATIHYFTNWFSISAQHKFSEQYFISMLEVFRHYNRVKIQHLTHLIARQCINVFISYIIALYSC